MKKTILVALAITLGAGANVALAEGSPELNRPFGGQRYYSAPSLAAAPGPVDNDAQVYARLQADGYRAINVARGTDGAWHGTAIRGAAKVNVHVAPDGRVITR